MDPSKNHVVDEEESRKFKRIVHSLLLLTEAKNECDKRSIVGYLKALNDLDFRKHVILDANDAMVLSHHLSSIVQPRDTVLVIEFSQLIVSFMKQNAFYKADITFKNTKRWVLECLEFCNLTAVPHVLCAVQSVFAGPIDGLFTDLEKVLSENSILLRYIYPLNQNFNEIQYLALGCLRAILNNKEAIEGEIPTKYISKIKSTIFIVINRINYEKIDKTNFNKIAILCLKMLRDLFKDKTLSVDKNTVGELLGVVQAYLFHGLAGYPNIEPMLLRPSTLNLPDLTHSTQKKKYFRNHKTKARKPTYVKGAGDRKQTSAPESKANVRHSSDSDTSDTERNNLSETESKVRLEAAFLLNLIVVNTQSRDLFGFWTQVVAGGRPDARVLTRSILKETDPKVRQTALSILNDLIVGGRTFLSHAEDVANKSLVTCFIMLSSVIKEIHGCLSFLLTYERNIVVLTQTLKCASALVQGTPYSRLKPGLATRLSINCRNHLYHKDPTVRIAALSVFESLTLTEPITPEIFQILARSSNTNTNTELSNEKFNTANNTENEEIVYDDFYVPFVNVTNAANKNVIETNCENQDNVQRTEMSVLLQYCLKNISNGTMNEPVRLQSLKLLGTLAFNASRIVFPHLETITKTLIDITKEPQVASHACRVMEIIAGRLSDLKSEQASEFWDIAFKPIISLATNSEPLLREVACDCLGNIGDEVLAELSKDKNILLITVLLTAARDEEKAVKAASMRSLGLLVTSPALEDDTGFIMDVINVTCEGCEDRNLGVRVKAIWALASLSDCLVKRENNPEVEPIQIREVLPTLYRISVKMAQCNEKIKCNAVRAIGNIIYLCPEKTILYGTSAAVDALADCASKGNDAKVRWNACRAIGTVLSRCPDVVLPFWWKEKLFPILCDLVCRSPNFKVRTNAAWAFSVCTSFGKFLVVSWKSVLLALENSQHVPNYVEYGHRDALVQQLCLAFCHLVTYIELKDLESLSRETNVHIDDITRHIRQFQDHVLPEKAGDLVKAKDKCKLLAEQAKSRIQIQFSKKLVELFKRDERFDNVDAMPILH